MWNKIEREGKANQVKGKVKQAVGAVTGSRKLKAAGMVDETVGKVESAVGRATRKTGNAIARVRKAMK